MLTIEVKVGEKIVATINATNEGRPEGWGKEFQPAIRRYWVEAKSTMIDGEQAPPFSESLLLTRTGDPLVFAYALLNAIVRGVRFQHAGD